MLCSFHACLICCLCWRAQILLDFAVVASGYVLHAGLQQSGRSLYKLVLHCVMIIISVRAMLRLLMWIGDIDVW